MYGPRSNITEGPLPDSQVDTQEAQLADARDHLRRQAERGTAGVVVLYERTNGSDRPTYYVLYWREDEPLLHQVPTPNEPNAL